MPKEWILSEQNHRFISSQKWEVAVLPFGATESHNFHLPYGMDVFEADEIGSRACEYAYQRGAKVILLPTIPFGVNTNHLSVPGGMTISLNPTTLLKILVDVVESLSRHGVKKLVLLNAHGGNELKPLMRELHTHTDVFMCLCDWFRMAADEHRKIFDKPGDHADEIETSLGLAFFPERVQMELAGPGSVKQSRFEAIRKGWISITRPWHLINDDTGVGDPSAATAEKGRQLMEILVQRLGSFLVELAASPLDANFPY